MAATYQIGYGLAKWIVAQLWLGFVVSSFSKMVNFDVKDPRKSVCYHINHDCKRAQDIDPDKRPLAMDVGLCLAIVHTYGVDLPRLFGLQTFKAMVTRGSIFNSIECIIGPVQDHTMLSLLGFDHSKIKHTILFNL